MPLFVAPMPLLINVWPLRVAASRGQDSWGAGSPMLPTSASVHGMASASSSQAPSESPSVGFYLPSHLCGKEALRKWKKRMGKRMSGALAPCPRVMLAPSVTVVMGCPASRRAATASIRSPLP